MRTLTIAIALACIPFAASAQEGTSAKRVPAAAVREAAKARSQRPAGISRPAVQAADLRALRKQKTPRN